VSEPALLNAPASVNANPPIVKDPVDVMLVTPVSMLLLHPLPVQVLNSSPPPSSVTLAQRRNVVRPAFHSILARQRYRSRRSACLCSDLSLVRKVTPDLQCQCGAVRFNRSGVVEIHSADVDQQIAAGIGDDRACVHQAHAAIANVFRLPECRLVRQNLLTARGEDVILRVTGHVIVPPPSVTSPADYQRVVLPAEFNCTFPICE